MHEAFLEDSSKFSDIEILCRICEVKDPALSTKIAEYTNSQNPVKGRDIRSVDFVQLSLEKEFLINGRFYERKKNQYADENLNQRIDAEKAGQVLIAFFNKSPFEAKNRKGLIFGEKYEEVFNEGINADKVLLAYSLFEKIEFQKNRVKLNTVNNRELFEKKSYIVLASCYILHIIGELARRNKIDLIYANIQRIWDLYNDAVKVIESMISKEQNTIGRRYDNSAFFRSNRSKKYFEDLDDSELDSMLSVDEN